MSRRRQQRRADKTRRHLQPTHQPGRPIERSAAASPRVAVCEAGQVERLAYSRSQAAQALGISLSTLRRLLPYIETIELPWGTSLIPVDELARIATERRQTARPRLAPATRGRGPTVRPEIARRIHHERSTGKSLRGIADGLNDDRIPTAHGGTRWWPSTVRAVLQRPP
ncbi:MAG TPA: recombinase family protein [Gaiellaceae bacterium]|nr:recombinase family protein [Gaiellaceae bacterium]